MAKDTTEHNTTANGPLAGWVRLDSDPRELPPIEGRTFGGLTQGDDSRYPLPVQWGARAFDVRVGAPRVYRGLIDRLEQWQGKGFVQPVNAGARWHLQLRHVEEMPDQAPGVSSVVLRGFQIMIPPGEDAPIVYTFGKGEREMTDSLLPGVSVKVTERHDRRCDAVIAWTSAAGAVVADDLMARARDLWAELGGLEERADDQAKTPPAADDSSSEDRLTQYEERLRVDIGNANGTARRRLALIAVWRKNPTAVAKESYEILAAMLSKHDELAAPYSWNVRDDIEVVERESGISMRERRKPKTRM